MKVYHNTKSWELRVIISSKVERCKKQKRGGLKKNIWIGSSYITTGRGLGLKITSGTSCSKENTAKEQKMSADPVKVSHLHVI